MDVRLVALVASIVVFVLSAVVYLVVMRRYRERVRKANEAQEQAQGYNLFSATKIPEPATIALLSFAVSVLSLISSVVLGILQLMK